MSSNEQHQFQAEIQQLLDIVIHSLYTDREICVRELLSNAADACEKLRFQQASGGEEIQSPELAPAISVTTDEAAGTLTITDTGVGMSRSELVENLGTIAHSGTKAFVRQLSESKKPDAKLIGQFGVGFYSAFMVAKKVTVQTRSWRTNESSWRWSSEGANGYEITPETDLPRGTRVTLDLKDDARDFAKADMVEHLIRRYSNFIQFPIDLNGKRINTVQAIWARNRNEIKPEEYEEFYKYIGHDGEAPLYRLHYTTDGPLSLQALLFVPPRNFEGLGLFRTESQVHLYSRKVLIESQARGLLPDWLRFLKGVVDSEDIPLNVSRERMQDSQLLHKIQRAITSRFLKYLEEQAEKEPDTYEKFYTQFVRFLKEGALNDLEHSKNLISLLRFESSMTDPGKKASLGDYVKRMPSDQKEIYFLLGANRAAIEASPYFEVFRQRKLEVLFLYDPVDEFIFDRSPEFQGKTFRAAEKAEIKTDDMPVRAVALPAESATSLAKWLKEVLGDRVSDVRISERLVQSPAVIVDRDKHLTSTMRRTLRQIHRDQEAPPIEAPDFEVNPHHDVLIKLDQMRQSDSALAGKVAAQLYDNARMAAGVLEDPREMLARMNDLLQEVLSTRQATPAPEAAPTAAPEGKKKKKSSS